MIFIKNKNAWKEFVREVDGRGMPEIQPREYPFFLENVTDESEQHKHYVYTYRSDLVSMIRKIDSGREF